MAGISRPGRLDGYGYSRFCDLYGEWRRGLTATMRQTHAAGEKLFVDFAGDTAAGVRRAHRRGAGGPDVRRGARGVELHLRGSPCCSEALPDWIGAHVNAFTFLGGVPKAVVCDNLKAGVTAASRYEPGVNRTYQELAEHYGTAISADAAAQAARQGQGRRGGADRPALDPGAAAQPALLSLERAQRGDPRTGRGTQRPPHAQARQPRVDEGNHRRGHQVRVRRRQARQPAAGRRGLHAGLVAVLACRRLPRGCRPEQLRQAVRPQLADRSGVRLGPRRRQAAPPLPPDIVDATRARYIEAYERISGLQVRRLDRAAEAARSQARRRTVGSITATCSSTPTSGCATSRTPKSSTTSKAENDYTEQATDDLAPLRQKIFDEIKARTKETDLSVPTRRGDWWYYGRSFEGKQYSVQCRCPVIDPDDWTPPQLDEHTEIPGEQILLDENVEAEGHDFFALGAATVSLDGNILAYSVDVKGDERYTLRFKDLRTGELYDDEIVGIGAGATWAADNHTIYYVTVDDAWRPDTVWRHRLGSGLPAERVYHEPDEKFWLAVGRTRSSKYVIIAAGSAVTSEMRYGDATDGAGRVHHDLAAP